MTWNGIADTWHGTDVEECWLIGQPHSRWRKGPLHFSDFPPSSNQESELVRKVVLSRGLGNGLMVWLYQDPLRDSVGWLLVPADVVLVVQEVAM